MPFATPLLVGAAVREVDVLELVVIAIVSDVADVLSGKLFFLGFMVVVARGLAGLSRQPTVPIFPPRGHTALSALLTSKGCAATEVKVIG